MLGFENAPVSQGFIILTILATLFLVNDVKSWLSLDLNKLAIGQEYRLVTSQLIFDNVPQAIVGSIIIYGFRNFERQMGSRKFGAFLMISFILNLIIELILSVIITSSITTLKSLIVTSGPFFYIYALVPFYYNYVPAMHSTKYKILGIPITISQKLWLYVLLIELFFSGGLSSIMSGISGILSGFIYLSNVLGIQRLRLPEFIIVAFNFIGSLYSSTGNNNNINIGNNQGNGNQNGLRGGGGGGSGIGARYGTNDMQTQEQTQGHGHGNGMMDAGGAGNGFGNDAVPDLSAFIGPPPREMIDMLVEMGFDEASATRALRATGNNLEAAASRLLQG